MNAHAARLAGLLVLTSAVVAAVFASPQDGPAGASVAQTPPQAHRWNRIQFPQLPELSDGSTPTANIFNNRKGDFALTISFPAPSPPAQLSEADKIVVRLHRPDGTVIAPSAGSARPASVSGTVSYGYAFPWGENVLEEASIEMKLTDRTYWFELPYGFTRNPADPMTPVADRRGVPRPAPAMKALSPADRIVPWLYVTYDLGQIENRQSVMIEMANPFDANATVVLYKADRQPWSLTSPKTSLTIVEGNGRILPSTCVNLHIHDDRFRRSDTFKFYRAPSRDGQRDWGTAHLAVDGIDHAFTIPSSLFKYIHGTSDPDGRAMLKRPYPFAEGITATNGPS